MDRRRGGRIGKEPGKNRGPRGTLKRSPRKAGPGGRCCTGRNGGEFFKKIFRFRKENWNRDRIRTKLVQWKNKVYQKVWGIR
jgi:hypothetical protein